MPSVPQYAMTLYCSLLCVRERQCLFILVPIDGLSLLNEDGGLKVFFPRNSFVTNTTLTHTNTPRLGSRIAPANGNDHIVCYGGNPEAAQVAWHNTSEKLIPCGGLSNPLACVSCGPACQRNGGVGVDLPLNGHTNIHIYINSTSYGNQDLECQVNITGGTSAFIGVYLTKGGGFGTKHNCSWLYYIIECEFLLKPSKWRLSTNWCSIEFATIFKLYRRF